MVELSITIPFYNEEKNIENVVKPIVDLLNKNKIDYELVLINNGSKDKTGEIINSLMKKNKKIKKVVVEVNQGYGNGIINGLKFCNGKYIGWVDGDGQVEPQTLVNCYNKIKDSNLGMVKGIRETREDGINRIINSFGYNNMVRIFFGSGTKDVNAKPKIFKKEIFDKANLKSKDWFIDTELLVKTRKLGYSIEEVSTIFLKRKEGKSNVRFRTILEFIKNLWRFRKEIRQFS